VSEKGRGLFFRPAVPDGVGVENQRGDAGGRLGGVEAGDFPLDPGDEKSEEGVGDEEGWRLERPDDEELGDDNGEEEEGDDGEPAFEAEVAEEDAGVGIGFGVWWD